MYGDGMLLSAATIDGGRSCACALSAEKKDRKQTNSMRAVLTTMSVLHIKRRAPSWLSPCGQLGDEVYEDEGDSEDSALRDEP